MGKMEFPLLQTVSFPNQEFHWYHEEPLGNYHSFSQRIPAKHEYNMATDLNNFKEIKTLLIWLIQTYHIFQLLILWYHSTSVYTLPLLKISNMTGMGFLQKNNRWMSDRAGFMYHPPPPTFRSGFTIKIIT